MNKELIEEIAKEIDWARADLTIAERANESIVDTIYRILASKNFVDEDIVDKIYDKYIENYIKNLQKLNIGFQQKLVDVDSYFYEKSQSNNTKYCIFCGNYADEKYIANNQAIYYFEELNKEIGVKWEVIEDNDDAEEITVVITDIQYI